MELKDLSQNWRKLQETLKQSKTPPTVKRKAPAADSSSPTATKRRRTVPKTRNHTRKPSSTLRKSRMSETASKPSASVALWAEGRDIPVDELPAGVSLKSTSLPNSTEDPERVNEGLSAAYVVALYRSCRKFTGPDYRSADIGRYIAVDCEMVGVGPNPDKKSALARVSIVNFHGVQIYDSFVEPKERVTDWRTHVSGITQELIENARTLEEVQRDVTRIMTDRILVGHALRNDLDALFLGHPRRDIRDTSRHKPFRALCAGNTPSLKLLASELLGVEIQGGKHSSVEDARACMLLYRRDKDTFEREHAKRWPKPPPPPAVEEVAEKAEGGDTVKKRKNKKKKKRKN